MRALVQRVRVASVTVDNTCVASIKKGLLVFIGFGHEDTTAISESMIQKLYHLRLFQDEEGKMNKSVKDIDGEILLVSQFTLYGNCDKGRRPHFLEAMNPEMAEPFFTSFVDLFKSHYPKVQSGIFGANMQVALENDGPVTFFIEK